MTGQTKWAIYGGLCSSSASVCWSPAFAVVAEVELLRRLPRGRVVLAGVFLLLALNAWAQVLLVPLGRSDDPASLTILQSLIGLAGTAAAWGSWSGARWAPMAAVLHGVVTAGMLLALPPILDLGADERGGLRAGAVAVLVFALGSAWYLRRVSRSVQR